MQSNYEMVGCAGCGAVPMRGVGDWLEELKTGTIMSIPTWAFLAGAAGVFYYMKSKKGGKGKRRPRRRGKRPVRRIRRRR